MTPRPPLRWPDLQWLRVIILIISFLLTTAILRCCAAEPPPWVLRGLIAVETSSHFNAAGQPVYVNQARGRAGEIGITQAMPRTLRRFKLSPSLFEQDPAYALAATRHILASYYAETGTWWNAVAKWNQFTTYTSPSAQRYALQISIAGGEGNQ